jgi:hypothetical protein
MDMDHEIFKDPSFLGAYHGAIFLIHPSTQVCAISSNRTETRDTIPPTEASPPLNFPPGEAILPQKLPEKPMTPLTPDFTLPQGKILVWETIPQDLTQIPFFYPPPDVQDFQVATILTLPNMVLSILVWYLHLPVMVPQSSLPPQLEGIPMQIPVLTPTTLPSLLIASTTLTPNLQHHHYKWGKTEEERSHSSNSSLSSTSLCTLRERGTTHKYMSFSPRVT